MRRGLFACATAALLGVGATPSVAAIALRVEVSAEVAERVSARILVRNDGDEPAFAVTPAIEFGQIRAEVDTHPELPPGFRQQWNTTLPLPPLGIHPVVIRVRYRDADGHPASAPIIHLLRTGPPDPDGPNAVLTMPPLDPSASGTLELHSRGGQPHPVRVRMIGPDELVIDPDVFTMEVSGDASPSQRIAIENHGALPGNQQPLFALLEWELDGRPIAQLASTIVTTADPDATSLRIPFVMVVLILLAIALTALALRWRQRHAQPSTRAERRRRPHQ